jgi:hypothetical protein
MSGFFHFIDQFKRPSRLNHLPPSSHLKSYLKDQLQQLTRFPQYIQEPLNESERSLP